MSTHGRSSRHGGYDAAKQAVVLSRLDIAMSTAALEILSESAADLAEDGVAPDRELIDTMADLLGDREPFVGLYASYMAGRISPRAALVAACVHRRNARRIGR